MVRLRCIRCRKVLGEDGKCQNKDCVLYIPVYEQEEPVIETPIEAVKEL